ncbi:MAG: hypothetical protein PHX21_06780 [bacterium]|nr:hypothetical protein [bacterium]
MKKQTNRRMGKSSRKITTEFPKNADGKFICPECDQPMNKISQRLLGMVYWKWDKKKKMYSREEELVADADKPICEECENRIDWEYVLLLNSKKNTNKTKK